MSQSLEDLTRRTGTMRAIRGIVHTMKTLSAINAHPYEQAALAIEGYRDTVLDGLQAFVRRHGRLSLPQTAGARHVIIAFGSDQGLCGNYNELVAERVAAHLAQIEDRAILCVGAQMQDALEGAGLTPGAVLLPPASAEGLGRLAGDLVRRIDAARAAAGRAVTVTLVHTERAPEGRQAPAVQRVLPLDSELAEALARRPWTSASLPWHRMEAEALLAALLRNYLFAAIFRAAAEALVTENAARLARMQQAEQTIDERLEELGAETRLARQTQITEELLDVIVGFEALSARRRRKDRAAGAA